MDEVLSPTQELVSLPPADISATVVGRQSPSQGLVQPLGEKRRIYLLALTELAGEGSLEARMGPFGPTESRMGQGYLSSLEHSIIRAAGGGIVAFSLEAELGPLQQLFGLFDINTTPV